MIARLPGICFSSLYFFELRFFCVSSLGLLCSWFIWLYSNASFCYLLMLHQLSIFVRMKCLMWNTIGVYYMLHVYASALFVRRPVKQLSLHIFWCNCLIKKNVVADRLSTGFAVADLDLSKVEAVRTRMPISEVLLLSQAPTIPLFQFQPGPEVLL